MANNANKGKLPFPAGYYEGEILDGKPHGKGKYTWSDGSYYEGDFINNKRHGIGKMTYPDGRIEEGNWKDGEFVGE